MKTASTLSLSITKPSESLVGGVRLLCGRGQGILWGAGGGGGDCFLWPGHHYFIVLCYLWVGLGHDVG